MIEISVPPKADLSRTARMIERSCVSEGLRMHLKGVLSGYTGCVHWQFTGEPHLGTLEVTLWPGTRRIWFSGREETSWIAAPVARVKAALENTFS